MRRIPHWREESAATSAHFRTSRTTRSSPISQPRQAQENNILNVDRRKINLDDSEEEKLASALAAQDRELASVIEEVDRVSAALKTDAPDAEALSNTLRRTVMCAVKQSLLDRELRSLALKDDLTGLYNRRAFLTLASQQLRVTRRQRQGLLLFFADVDHLKEINDVCGHQDGDLALVRAAGALKRTFRNSDIIARVGGDEFAVLALEASCENREIMLQRLEKNLKSSRAKESHPIVSLSVGMARLDPNRPASLEKLIATADEAMYEEKKKRPKFCVVEH
jgi:diguanylate cyclase (GGDEF)-like protein